MKPIIKSYHSLEMFEVDEFYKPEDIANFGFTFELQIGLCNSEIEESFTFFVCSPKWLLQNLDKNEVTLGLNYLFMQEYDFSKLKIWLENYISNCSADNWNEIVKKVSRLGRWENDDFTKWPENIANKAL